MSHCLFKSVNHSKPLRVHETGGDGRPLCVHRVPKFRSITGWQTDPGPANCKICSAIKNQTTMPKVKSVNIHVFQQEGKYRFNLTIDEVPQRHSRMDEPCDTIHEAIGYARHALRELAKDKQT